MKKILLVIFSLITITGFAQTSRVTKYVGSSNIKRDTVHASGTGTVNTNYGITGDGSGGNPVQPDFDQLTKYITVGQNDYVVGSIGDNPSGAIIKVKHFGRDLYPVTNYTSNGTLADSVDTWNNFSGTSLTATMPANPIDNQWIVIFNNDATNLTVGTNSKNYNGSNVARTLMQYEVLEARYSSGEWHGQINQNLEAYKTYTVQSGSVTMVPLYSRYVYTGGGTATFTLPTPTGNGGLHYFIKNRGGNTLTVASNSGSQIWTSGPVASITLAAGASHSYFCDGTYFNEE